MATFVSAKCTAKDIAAIISKDQARKTLGELISRAVNDTDDFSTSTKTPVNILLTVAYSLTTDDKDKPRTMTFNVVIDGTLMGGAAPGFHASGGATMKQGLNVKKIDQNAALLMKDVVPELMTKKVIPQMRSMVAYLKPSP